jgi:hypothetical protein
MDLDDVCVYHHVMHCNTLYTQVHPGLSVCHCGTRVHTGEHTRVYVPQYQQYLGRTKTHQKSTTSTFKASSSWVLTFNQSKTSHTNYFMNHITVLLWLFFH